MLTSVKLAAYSHSAADSPKKVRVQKHPQKSSMIFSPLDLTFFQQIFPKKVQSPELAAYSHSAADSPKKVRVQKHP